MGDTTLILVQVSFIIIIWFMAFIAGILPNIIPWCKKSTSLLGIANAFSGGVFLSIAFIHILPEVSTDYASYMDSTPTPKLGDDDEESDNFPLPFALAFGGYAFILLIDKVIFDTHSLVGGDHHGHLVDPAQAQFIGDVKNSFLQFQKMANDHNIHQNGINDSDITNKVIKNYLSRNDKFSVRMSVALRPQSKKDVSKTFIQKDKGLDDEQKLLFADQDNIELGDTAHRSMVTPGSDKKSKCS
jgi:hypothetical protein